MNILSPTSNVKSPKIDYGIIESIDNGKDRLIAGYDKWKLASLNGTQFINLIHAIKDKARKSSDSNYPVELEVYCKKLENIQAVFYSIIGQVTTLQTQMKSSLNILTTMNESDELRNQIMTIEQFLRKLKNLYQDELKVKNHVIGKRVK